MWLGPINLLIGVFNLIPAFPLDGGRVLRSILWALSGDLRVSTRRASFIGQMFGWLFIVMGIAMFFGMHVPFFGSGPVSGLWLAFIGWFLRSAALQAYSRLAIDEALDGHVVSEVMRRGAPVVSPELPLTTLVHDYFVRSDERALPVLRDDVLVGVISNLGRARGAARRVGSDHRGSRHATLGVRDDRDAGGASRRSAPAARAA